MRFEGYLFTFVGIFFAASTPVYWFTSHDPTGTALLVLSCLLGVLIAWFSLYNSRRIGDRPSDRPEADIDEGAGEIGFFSPHSWWPLPLAASAAVSASSVVFGWWIAAIGGTMLAISLCGLVFEYYVTGQH